MNDLSRLAQEQGTLEYQAKAERAQKRPELIRIGTHDPTTGRDRIIFPNDGEAIAGNRTFNSSVPYGSPVRASQPYGSQVVSLDSRRHQPPEELEEPPKTTKGFVLFLCLDQTGSIGSAGAKRGLEIIERFKDAVGNRKILGIGFVSFGDIICQTFDIDDKIDNVKTELQKAIDSYGPPFFCDGGGDVPENGVDALAIAYSKIVDSKIAKMASHRYIFLKTDVSGFAHNSQNQGLVRTNINSGKITKTFLEFDKNYDSGGTNYAVAFPESKYISHKTFEL